MSLPDPKSLLLSALGFLVVLLILRKLLFQAVADLLAARQREVSIYYSDAEESRKAADELKTQYETHLANTAEEMRVKIAEAIKEGQAMRDQIIAESRSKADGILTKAQEEILREKDKAIVELKGAMATLAVDAAGRLIQEKLDPEKHRQLIDGFIEDLGARN